MNEELNKELCGLLGIQWHEPEVCPNCGYYCTNKTVFCTPPLNNPDFTSDPVALLREMMKRDDWEDFADRHLLFSHWDTAEESVYAISTSYLLDDTGKLAIAARDFLKGK